MADNYLEKKFEELREKRPVIKRNHLSLDTLLHRNRSYRGYDPSRAVTREELKKMVEATTLVPSGKNQQALRYRLVTAEESDKVLPLIRLGAALPELHLPFPGTEPRAFLVVCSTVPENPVLDIDLGIAAQSLLLKAVEMGLNGLIIRSFDPGKMQEALGLALTPLLVIAIGKGAESIYLKPVDAGEPLNYYRKDGVHFVPKLKADDLIL
jgi:nitroreductase